MSFKIIITPKAQQQFESLIDYLDDEWGDKVINRFLFQFSRSTEHILMNPLLFPSYNNMNIRRCVVTKHNSLFYRVVADRISIITIWDNRMNPDMLHNAITS